MPKLGLTPGKDVTLIPTGLGRSDLRLQLIFQGKIDATLGTADNVFQLGLKGQKLSVLADLTEMGVVTTGGDFAATRRFLQENRPLVKTFLMALSEAIWLGKSNKEIAFKVLRKYLKVQTPAVLESMHKNYLLGTIPAKPFPSDDAVQTALDEVGTIHPQLKEKKPRDFTDPSIVTEIDNEGFFTRLQR
jgi:ABC-type nitrate/sulfonate/bicarbonate transport system substrate-binding protein